MIRWFCGSIAILALATAAQAQSDAYLLGDGVKVDLGEGWEKRVVPSPVMNQDAAKDLLSDAKEIRMKNGQTGILVSLMTWKSRNDGKLDELDPVQMSREVSEQYLPQARESQAVSVARLNGNVRVAMVTLNAKEGERFKVRSGYPGGCVTSGVVRKGLSVMAVSIASDSCQSEPHQRALAAFLGAHE